MATPNTEDHAANRRGIVVAGAVAIALLSGWVVLMLAHPATIAWHAGMERGTVEEWSSHEGGGIFFSGLSKAEAVLGHAHSGRYALRAEISTPSSPASGVRALRWAEPRRLRQAYFGVWLFVPVSYELTGSSGTGRFWNVLQFKSRTADGTRNDPVWALYATPDGRGHLYLRAGWGWGGTTLAGPTPTADVSGKWFEPVRRTPIPIGRWFHLQVLLRQSRAFDGRLVVWQDGQRLFDFDHVRTSYNNCNYDAWCSDDEWGVNLYSDGMRPSPAVLYMDDATISTVYIRPDGRSRSSRR
jgi:hypothetical protein